ncbi:MAG TPA: chemotaxis protein CheW [Candidatus Eisenbacteria bacterium]|nr:chemotaxis protein CheW [Candidatus Eisenbacteria bacterium]
MIPADQLDARSCVLLRLGERRFALTAEQIAELVAPSRVFRFAHRTPELDGVILRRGRVVPVCDVAEKLIGKRLTSRRFYLIATRRRGASLDWIALPVSGECELITADLTAAGASDSPHVAAWLSHDGEVIEVLNLDALTPVSAEYPAPSPATPPEAHA